MPDALYLMPLICGVVLLAAAGRPVLLAVGIVFLASCFLWQRGEPLLRGARGVDLGPVRMTILAERSDRITSACVVQDRVNGERILYTEAFSAAGGESSTYMRALGLLPMMLGPAKGELCVICLGTGTTAGAMARSAGRRTLHLVEISRAVWHLSKYFAESRAAWNAAPGLELHLADGRQFLEGQSAGSLAAVTLEPLLPQAPGSVHLYSKEFYTAAHEALMPSGLCVQWLPTHALGRDDFLSLAKSFAHVFAELELYLVDNASILIGRKGGKAARTPVQLSHGKDAFLTGLWSEEDLALAQLPLAVDRLRKAKVPLVLDDRPFLETRAYASARKKAAWLEENLRLLLSWFPEAEADSNDSLNEARKLRLLARMQIARRSSDPNSDGYAFAVRMLGQALEMWPRSSLLQLEYEGAVALLETEQAMRSLARSRLRDCLEHVERALAHGAVRPEVLAARACALFRLGKKKAARVVVQELARFHSEYKLLPKIAMRAGSSLAALFDEAELQVPDDVSASSKELSFQAARENFAVDYAAGKAWARTFRLRKPRVAEWYVLDAVRRGKLSGLDALQSFVETLDQAGLSLLRGPASMRPELARVLLRKLPGRLPLPNWLRALASGSEEDKIALLAGLERRKSHANLMLVLDLLEQEAQTAAVLLPAFGLLLRWRPDAKFYRPDLVAVERREKVRAFRRKILAEQGR